MAQKKSDAHKNTYALTETGEFFIRDYNSIKPFSNFFPGVAGEWGTPMWVFYVNRGQCIASFGVESKDKAIMEFQPANKAYRITTTQGFRTFVKVTRNSKTVYWEPFQQFFVGTDFSRTQAMAVAAHGLTLKEVNQDLGVEITVDYFTVPEEPCSALVRRVTFLNTGTDECSLEVIDGLPVIVPYGISEWALKNMSRTIEAWIKVSGEEKHTPYYQLTVEASDKPQVTRIKQGNFFFSYDETGPQKKLLPVIVEAAVVFGPATDFAAPAMFLESSFQVPTKQETHNRMPSAFCYAQFSLAAGTVHRFSSLFGYAHDEQQVARLTQQVSVDFIEAKAKRNRAIVEAIRNYAFTKSSSTPFDLYASHTFLDNILRGGLPVSLKTKEGNVSFNVYSRKHGDLERDYNYFTVAPTFFSQGNGNYRDVNQNRRNDAWFNGDVKDSSIITFLNLSQADGYNPLVVKGTSFLVEDKTVLAGILHRTIKGDANGVLKILQAPFLPGALLSFIENSGVRLTVPPKEFLSSILEICSKQELADHGEGYWSDHWTYNLDLIERYVALYPEKLQELLFDKKIFSFYHDAYHILPRDHRYILTDAGVRQYHSVCHDKELEPLVKSKGHILRVKDGHGGVYYTNLLGKLLCLIANKAASFDLSSIGIEMEADKPNWYDALNGLPGLLGSSLSETFELKRFSSFVLESIKQLGVLETEKVMLFEELASFVSGLSHILGNENEPYQYWMKSNDVKEHYRQRVRRGINGKEVALSIGEVKTFLSRVIAKCDAAAHAARSVDGFLPTYFYHEVTTHEPVERSRTEGAVTYVRPLAVTRHALPLFLEGYVHALRAGISGISAAQLYGEVRTSPLFDLKLAMYKVNADISKETEEIGRTRVFPRGWLENESIWLHMEYKFLLELLRCGLFAEFYENFKKTCVPFLSPEVYGRSILENSSFIVSSAHHDASLHGQGFVARLSGSTAEFLHIWLLMNVGEKPFIVDVNKNLRCVFQPALPGWLFTDEQSVVPYCNAREEWKMISLPAQTYSFKFLGEILVVYHNKDRKDTFGPQAAHVTKMELTYPNRKNVVTVTGEFLAGAHAEDVRDKKVERIDVYFE